MCTSFFLNAMEIIQKVNSDFRCLLTKGDLLALYYSLHYFTYRKPQTEEKDYTPQIEEELNLETGTLRAIYDEKIAPRFRLRREGSQEILFTHSDFKAIIHFVGKDLKLLEESEYQTVTGAEFDETEDMLRQMEEALRENA